MWKRHILKREEDAEGYKSGSEDNEDTDLLVVDVEDVDNEDINFFLYIL